MKTRKTVGLKSRLSAMINREVGATVAPVLARGGDGDDILIALATRLLVGAYCSLRQDIRDLMDAMRRVHRIESRRAAKARRIKARRAAR